MTKSCEECGTKFKAKDNRTKMCSDKCKRARSRWYNRERSKERAKLAKKKRSLKDKKVCIVCEKKFTPYCYRSVTCGSKYCIRENRYRGAKYRDKPVLSAPDSIVDEDGNIDPYYLVRGEIRVGTTASPLGC